MKIYSLNFEKNQKGIDYSFKIGCNICMTTYIMLKIMLNITN